MKRLRALRAAAAATIATAALSLGVAAPAHAANVEWRCQNYSDYHVCETYTGAALYDSGYAGISAVGNSWEVVNVPRNGFTLYVRVWPTQGRPSIDYPASQDGRVLSYGIYAIQIVVSGHETSNRIFI
ncbi:hypothetical protein KOI35_07975 [Actinoplanes bogorensis]|uniref:Uncharacterized protein n=1 Tax=Paractinoplanes bogorensis TaxID=1610840 RepID=A0ABS5YK81_9ACTN|nr:hypothetical protein [Actinoplanes bogorensis]MBU2663441.1 hypothetical protein [Actinoplanes bogorensis]